MVTKSNQVKTVTSNDRSFDNWFESDSSQEKQTPKRITLKKADGRLVGLDDYENDLIW